MFVVLTERNETITLRVRKTLNNTVIEETQTPRQQEDTGQSQFEGLEDGTVDRPPDDGREGEDV